MRAARIHGYKRPLRIEEIPVPDIGPDEVLVKVAAAGMCRSDFQLVDRYFQEGLPVSFPITPGHEVAGTIAGGKLGAGPDFNRPNVDFSCRNAEMWPDKSTFAHARRSIKLCPRSFPAKR